MAIDINLNNVAPKDVADAHYSDTNNPHGVTVGQIGAQPTLVSGVNIKTINSISLLGSGNISISSTNFANGNLTLDNDRTHDFANKQMTWNNVKQFKLVASVAPPIGEASFRLRGFGSTGNDRHFALRNSADNKDFFAVYGDGSIEARGVAINGGNVNIGIGAGNAANISCVNIGSSAGAGNALAENTFIGVVAGNGSSGQKCTAVGVNAGSGNTRNNQAVLGWYAGRLNTGDNQTAIGYLSGISNTGANQTAVGLQSGSSNIGSNQTAVGFIAGASNSGANQVVIGQEAGESNTATSQTAVGYRAGRFNTGINATSIGHQAGISNSFSNVFIAGVNAVAGEANSISFGTASNRLTTITTETITPTQTMTIWLNGSRYKIPLIPA